MPTNYALECLVTALHRWWFKHPKPLFCPSICVYCHRQCCLCTGFSLSLRACFVRAWHLLRRCKERQSKLLLDLGFGLLRKSSSRQPFFVSPPDYSFVCCKLCGFLANCISLQWSFVFFPVSFSSSIDLIIRLYCKSYRFFNTFLCYLSPLPRRQRASREEKKRKNADSANMG
jgi:hypothetical protein